MNVKTNPEFWPEDVPESIEYPEILLPEILRRSAKKYPDNPAIIFMDNRITYKTLDELTDRFATALNALGVQKGDKVALFMPNMPQFIIAFYGTLRVGGIVTTISPLYRERELEYQLNNSDAETIVVGWGPGRLTKLYSLVMRIRGKTKLKRVIVTSIKEYLPGIKKFFAGLLVKFHHYRPKKQESTILKNFLRIIHQIHQKSRSNQRKTSLCCSIQEEQREFLKGQF